MDLATEHGYQHLLLMAGVSQAWARARRGGDPAAEAARMRELTDELARAGNRSEQARRLLYTADTFLLAGDDAMAARCLDDARAVAKETGEVLPAADVERVEAGMAARATQHS